MGEIVAFVQARMGSTRLPGKVLAPVLGVPMLSYELERLSRARRLSRIIVVTSCRAADDELCDFLAKSGYPFYRGSEEDVLDRYFQAALALSCEQIVRVTADCPLIDPDLVDRVVQAHIDRQSDYTSSRRVLPDASMRHTYPHGTDTEIMTMEALSRAWREARLPSEREHVTMYIYRHPERFKLTFVDSEVDYGHLRWTVDYPEDLEFIREVYSRLYPRNRAFLSSDIYELLEREPLLLRINANVDSVAGLKVSAEKDCEFILKIGKESGQ